MEKTEGMTIGKESSYKDPFALCSAVRWTGHGDTYVRLNPEKFMSYLDGVEKSLDEMDTALNALKAKLPEKLTMKAAFGGMKDEMKDKYSKKYSDLAGKIKDSIKGGPARWPEALRTVTYDFLLTKRDERREAARLERVTESKGLPALQEMSMVGFDIETGKRFVDETKKYIGRLKTPVHQTGNAALNLENIGAIWRKNGDVESMRHNLDDALETIRTEYEMAQTQYTDASKMMQEVK